MDQETRDIFDAARTRYAQIEAAHRATDTAVTILRPKLEGKQIVKDGKRYEISDISNGYDGMIKARGRRILPNGKTGTQVWDIGFICASYFEDAEAQAAR